MSFGESVFFVGFIQKTIKVNLDDRLNRAYPQRKQPQKVPEDSRGHHTKAKHRQVGSVSPTYMPTDP